jgi:divalent metal cation (Fe/Co/Zn/Cd) transporter
LGNALDRSNELRYRASMRVTLVSVVVNVLLSAAQVAAGIIGKSQA